MGTKEGRRNPHEIILVNLSGLPIEDVAPASYICQKAREKGMDVRLER